MVRFIPAGWALGPGLAGGTLRDGASGGGVPIRRPGIGGGGGGIGAAPRFGGGMGRGPPPTRPAPAGGGGGGAAVGAGAGAPEGGIEGPPPVVAAPYPRCRAYCFIASLIR